MGKIMRLREYDTNNTDLTSIIDGVMGGDITVIHGVLSEMQAAAAVKAAIDWTRLVPPFDTEGGTASPEAHQNFHRVDNNPPLSKTKHIFIRSTSSLYVISLTVSVRILKRSSQR